MPPHAEEPLMRSSSTGRGKRFEVSVEALARAWRRFGKKSSASIGVSLAHAAASCCCAAACTGLVPDTAAAAAAAKVIRGT